MKATISKEDARFCASVVKEVARAQGIVRDPAAIGRITAAVARLYNRGMHDREEVLQAAMQSVRLESDTAPASDDQPF
ncbi:hypothetical protein [Aliirhizobium cellulosilyticum]|jgi:hypothetical protein|uniref:Uncharacterized protein n=1 Tax=Aliirhizobium cellulosilyticum TaxID=393664 RepID=A0A7W6TLT5_9HYPH|nr:hypothetical protein [Rhizobium cellulosilyticum]MBB4351638.1 hypothetical protein [Rhizobium cellulosilyticum]MBB4414890.1 hypothetical protein [Rhizobium cellulosilyticum]MBB4449564.1 hypothetical protein [Rhizobium cellulosilyticum]